MPQGGRLILTIWLFVGIIICQLALTYYSMAILSAGRAYVNGEGHYSKGQKDAVYHLTRYAHHRDEVYFERYRQAIAIPLGDQQARLELEKNDPDLRIVRAGFTQAQNQPDDIDGMIMLFRRFRNVDYMARAIDIWVQADMQINQLASLADALRAEIRSSQPDDHRILALLEEINDANNQLVPLENNFSITLGAAQHKTQALLLSIMFGTAAILLLIGVLLSRHIFRQNEAVRRELHENAARFRSLTALSSDWYWEQDENFRFTELTGRVPDSYKRPLAAVIGKTRWEIEHVDMDEAAWQRHRQQLEQHEPFRDFEVRHQLDSQEVVIVSVNGEPKFDPSGHFTGYRGVARDITGTRHAEDLRAAKEAAELASRSKSAFLSRMSHELRTPLNAVLGFAQLLEYEPDVKSSASIQKKVEHIQSAGRHLLAMVDEILDLSRIESGTTVFSTGTVEIVGLFTECMMMTGPQADRRRIRVEFNTGTAAHWVNGDRTRLLQIAINILTNAIKYNRDGGCVYVDVGGDPTSVKITIRDTGLGLTPEQQAGLFQPFNRLGAEARVGGADGTGLGLVISKKLTESMQGSISVASQPGEGTAFTLVFPRVTAPVETSPVRPPLPLATISRDDTSRPGVFTVLYVEDNPANIELVREILRQRTNIQLEVATDGNSGLAAACRLKPDAILLDINLPGMDGIELIRRLRADPGSMAIPCLAISANAMPAEIKRAFDAGFSAYVVKPISIEDFLTKFDALISAKKSGPNPGETRVLSAN